MKRSFYKGTLAIICLLLVNTSKCAAFNILSHMKAQGLANIAQYTTFCLAEYLLKKHYPKHWQYQVLGAYGSGMKYSFFIPVKRCKTNDVWWDTGSLITGGGLVYRKAMFDKRFLGLYGYYNVMNDLDKELTLLIRNYLTKQNITDVRAILASKWLFPIRWVFGCEFGALDYGQLTLTGYTTSFPSSLKQYARGTLCGVSGRASVNLYSELKTFVCGSLSLVEVQPVTEKLFSWAELVGDQPLQTQIVKNLAIGLTWEIYSGWDIELKYFLQKKDYLSIHVGLRMSHDTLGTPNYFPEMPNQPPECYIPT